jgi:Carboxypeptidase regulatory-like domain/TonB dependent receptor
MKSSYKFSNLVYFAGLWILTVALFATTAFAQNSGAGTITGTLTDPGGSVVPGATVAVRNANTAATVSLTTNGAGIYVAPFLPPGMYEITASKTGFGTILRKDLTLQVGQTLTADLALPLQTTTETVTVTGEQSIVDMQKTDVSQVVSAGFVANLPIDGRRWENFVLLTPNATTDGDSGLISYRGISGLYNSTAVDGANNNVSLWSETRGRATGIAYVYSQDSVQEFSVSAANYSAELGGAAGGITNAVTKSGTNVFHGDLFYYLRYPTWNALDPIGKAQGIYTQPVKQQQQFGGSFGGPIIKDKLFFFGTYDGSRKDSPVIYTSTVKYPLPCPAQVAAAACLAANNFLAAQAGAAPRVFVQDTGFGKLDYQLNSKNRIASSFDLVDFHAANAYRTGNTYSNYSPTDNGAAVTHERIFITNWDSIITSSIINNARFQWGRDLETIGTNSGPPGVTIASLNVAQYGMPNALPRIAEPDEHRIQLADTLSMTHGTHTFKAGFDLNFIHEVMINLFYGGGVYTYTGSVQQGFANWVADVTGTNLGDGQTGRHWQTFTMASDPITGKGKDDFWMKDLAGFAEDTWKVRNNLTLTLGLRYDIQLVPQPPRPNTNTPLTTLYSSTINIDSNNFAPRVGAAWQLGKGTVLRAAYGMFYANTPGSTWYNIRVENGVFQQTYALSPSQIPGLTFPNVIFTPPVALMGAPFTGALTPQITSITPPQLGQIVHGLSPTFVEPLVHEGDVTFEKQLFGNMSFTAAYVFSRALHLPIYTDGNVAGATTTKSYDVVNTAGVTQSTFTVPFYTTRLNPATGVIQLGTSDVNSWYNSMVLTLRKNMSHGVEFLLNYTLSRAIDGAQTSGQFGTFFGTDVVLDPYNKKLEYGTSDMDQRHRFVGSVVYSPPFNRIANKPTRLLLNGFNFAAIVTIASGQPLTEYTSSYPSGGVDGGFTGAEIGTSAFATGGRVPFLPRNNYYLPNLYNTDFRIAREFRVHERYRLALVGEAFNLFNHTLITNVGPGSPPNAFSFSAAGSGVCSGHTNGCVVPNPAFPTATQTTSAIYAPRQLQVSARFSF